ncbi:MAG: sialidase family protein [Pirellulaceae bacterium]
MLRSSYRMGWILLLVAAGVAGRGLGQGDGQIEKLVKGLADEQFEVRETSMRALIEVGKSALPALERAAKSDDPEVAFRAKQAIRAITFLEPAEQARLREDGQHALVKGDNEAMVRAYRRLCLARNASLDDRRWLGHAHQLGGRWQQAAEAYAAVLEQIDHQLDDAADAADVPSTGGVVSREQLVKQRAALIVMLGRIQCRMLDKPAAAVATYKLAARHSDELNKPLDELAAIWKARIAEALEKSRAGGAVGNLNRYDENLHYPLLALRESADTQQQLGRFGEALETWRRIRLAARCYHGGQEDEIVGITRLLRKHETATGETPFELNLLDAEEPTSTFDLSDAETLARAYRIDNNYWTFCLTPPVGGEFATLKFDCDIEQFERRYGGQFDCWAMVGENDARRMGIGGIGWPADRELGRAVQSATYDIEPGTGAVHFRVGSWAGKFRVHQVKVTATFRERRVEAEPPSPTVGYIIQNECLPEGGELTLDGEPYQTAVASHGVAPGLHTYRYSHPERSAALTYAAEFQPGARYGLFINLDSPLESRLTNLRGFVGNDGGDSSLVRRKDGGWFTVWQAEGGTLRFATSDDLVRWSEPWGLAESGLYGDRLQCVSPSLHVDGEGELWLTYFSNRLDLEQLNSGGFRLFLTHSRDGREWSTPRPLTTSTSGWPPGAVQMTTGPDGMFWMFHRLMAASADSPAEVTRLEPLAIAGDDSLAGHARRPHAVFTADGRAHLVWDHFGQKLMYARRDADGAWSAAVELTMAGQGASASWPRLLLDGRRAALVYEKSGSWLRPGRITETGLELGEAVKLTDHVAPLSSLYLPTESDGPLAALCGKDTLWVRTVKRAELFEKLFAAGRVD